jgi:tyramine---L-glutamate ligase
MPRVFVYEHITTTGLGRAPASPEHSLFVEGNAMLSAITADFAAVPGVEVVPFPEDVAPADHAATFARLAASSRWSFLIAPETGGVLKSLAQQARLADSRLLGPSLSGIQFTSDKLTLSGFWNEEGVPTPHNFTTAETIRFPVVCKPRDGCGSEGLTLVRSEEEFAALTHDPNRLIQEFVPGQPASIAFLIGPKQTIPLLPTFQHISTDGRFCYLGGELPIPPDLADRAVALGLQAVDAIAGLSGYVGVDLVLGDRDVAIEINPRLTTSYVGLRALAETNLAGAMLDVCAGKPVNLKWKTGKVTFTADGTVKGQPA